MLQLTLLVGKFFLVWPKIAKMAYKSVDFFPSKVSVFSKRLYSPLTCHIQPLLHIINVTYTPMWHVWHRGEGGFGCMRHVWYISGGLYDIGDMLVGTPHWGGGVCDMLAQSIKPFCPEALSRRDPGQTTKNHYFQRKTTSLSNEIPLFVLRKNNLFLTKNHFTF